MNRDHRDEELQDDSPTDELPVLSELDVVDDFERTLVFAAFDDDETGAHEQASLAPEPPRQIEPPPVDPTLRFAPPEPIASPRSPPPAAGHDPAVAALEKRIAELTAWTEAAAAQIADKDATIASLQERLNATREAVARRDEAETQLRARLAERDARVAELEQAAEDSAAADREAGDAVAARLAEREARVADREAAADAAESRLDDRDRALADGEARIAAGEARLAECETALEELEAELSGRAAELTARESGLAARESGIAERESAVAERDAALQQIMSRELDEIRSARAGLERHVDAQLAAYAAVEARLREAPAPATAAAEPVEGDTAQDESAGAALRRSREHAAALESYIDSRRAYWHDMEARLAEQQSRIEELGAELEQRALRQRQAQEIAEAESQRVADLRSEVAALRKLAESRRSDDVDALRNALAERDTLLAGLTEQRDGLEQRLAEHAAQLERTRDTLRRLERTLIERDRTLDAKDARLKSLEAEIERRASAAPPDAGTSRVAAAIESRTARPAASPAAPTMVCLTGEAAPTYALRKPVVTIGRSSDCDIQIATHFVSREHARLTVRPGAVLIEDLGSKNGVFVNAVRVEREALQHGDLVTIGETQFRFMAG